MEEALRENKMRKQREIREAIKRQEKQNKREIILSFLIGGFVLIITAITLSNMNNNNYAKCMEKNNNKNICIRVYE